jgi:hemin uptake protein HemP
MEFIRGSGRVGEPRLAATPKIASDRLLNGRREIIIQHGREQYRLRITGAGKLLLTK